MGESRRVVITGLGVISPIGIGREPFWEGLRRGESAVREITRFDPTPFKSRIAAEVDGFYSSDHIEERKARRLDRFSQFSIAASRLALEDAELDPRREDPDRMGVMMGTALGGVAEAESQHLAYLKGGVREVDPSLALKVFAGASSCN
ncbi:MAG: beta-ketoacyl synthase N-terminal-like domain-containing protein, partial [Gemmatimonadota bacterium]